MGSALTSTASDPEDQTIGQVGFVIVDYPTLSSLEFPQLATVGSNFIIARNPKLRIIEFPNLTAVLGNVDITGDIQGLDFPALSYVGGNVNIQTSSANLVCPQFINATIVGSYACYVGLNNPQPLLADNSSINPSAVNPVPVPAPSTSTASSSSAINTQLGPSSATTPSPSSPTHESVSSSARVSSMTILILGFAFAFAQTLMAFSH